MNEIQKVICNIDWYNNYTTNITVVHFLGFYWELCSISDVVIERFFEKEVLTCPRHLIFYYNFFITNKLEIKQICVSTHYHIDVHKYQNYVPFAPGNVDNIRRKYIWNLRSYKFWWVVCFNQHQEIFSRKDQGTPLVVTNPNISVIPTM